MSTLEQTDVQPEQPAPLTKKQRKKKNAAAPAAAAAPASEPIEQLPELEDDTYYPEVYVVNDGYSLSSLLRAFGGGMMIGSVLTSAFYSYLNALRLKRAQEEFIAMEQQAKDLQQKAAPLPSEGSSSSSA